MSYAATRFDDGRIAPGLWQGRTLLRPTRLAGSLAGGVGRPHALPADLTVVIAHIGLGLDVRALATGLRCSALSCALRFHLGHFSLLRTSGVAGVAGTAGATDHVPAVNKVSACLAGIRSCGHCQSEQQNPPIPVSHVCYSCLDVALRCAFGMIGAMYTIQSPLGSTSRSPR